MKFFEVYTPKCTTDDMAQAVFIRDSFSWSAALLQPLWFAYHRLWAIALMVIIGHIAASSLALALDFSEDARLLVQFFAFLALGFHAHHIRGWHLQRHGYALYDITSGTSLEEAQRRFFDNHNES